MLCRRPNSELPEPSLVSANCSEQCLFKRLADDVAGSEAVGEQDIHAGTVLLDIEKRISESILTLTKSRGPTKSICPLEVCRKLFPTSCWRQHMHLVRKVGFSLAKDGSILVSQRNQILNLTSIAEIRGTIRFKITPDW